jgi:hypothetical protein
LATRAVAVFVFAFLAGLPAWAQPVRASGAWTWDEDSGAPRAEGMAGAFVALADDLAAVVANPAGLTLNRNTEIAVGLVRRHSATLDPGAVSKDVSSFGLTGLAVPLGRDWSAAFYFVEPHELRLAPEGAPEPGEETVHSMTEDLGLAVAWHPRERLRVGATASHARLDLVIDEARFFVPPEGMHRERLAVHEGAFGGGVGVLLRVTRRAVLGASARAGYRFHQDAADRGPFDLRSPHVGSLGAVYRLPVLHGGSYLLIAAETDYVTWRRLEGGTAVIRGDVGEGPDDGLVHRVGAEWNLPLSSQHLQLRAGAQRRPWRKAGAADQEVWVWSAGGSLLTSTGLRLHGAVRWGAERPIVTLGLALRFRL